MITDPLCPQQHTHPKHHPGRCIFCQYGAAVRHAEREACAQSDLDDRAYLLGQRAERDRIRQAVVPLLAPLLRHAPTAANWESTDALIRRTAGDIKRVIDALRGEQPPPLPPSVGVPIKPMWPLRGES